MRQVTARRDQRFDSSSTLLPDSEDSCYPRPPDTMDGGTWRGWVDAWAAAVVVLVLALVISSRS